MKNLILKPKNIIYPVIIWWFVFAILSITNFNPFQLLNILGFSFLIIVPGLLSIYLFDLNGLSFFGYAGLSVGMSVLELMFWVLIGDVVLPHIGVLSPLSKIPLLIQISVLVAISLCAVIFKNKTVEIKFKRFFIFESTRDLILSLIPIIFVILSIFGAIKLNNDGNGVLIYTMLICMAFYMAALIYYGEELGENVTPTALFFMSLSLLFMTSLRGWYITGHDINREFHVFELAKNAGIWNIASYKNAYNACMSITILPTIFSNLLKFADPYIYKVLFQIIFAIVPSILYVTIKRYATSVIAFLSTLFFISFPTFFNDMPMLNRQEIAFLFLALIIYIIFENELAIKTRRWLFVVLGVGIILSHYSTTYTFIALLIFLIAMRPVIKFLSQYTKKMNWFSKSGLETFNNEETEFKSSINPESLNKKIITIWMVVVLMLGSFLWTSILTGTSENSLYRVITETIAALGKNTKSDTQSNDVLYSFLSWSRPDINQQFKNYQDKIVLPTLGQAEPGRYYDANLYNKYTIAPLSQETTPLTSLGNKLSSWGVNVASFNYLFRQLSGKLLQFLILVGFLFILFSKKFNKKLLDSEFLLFSAGSMVFVLAIVVLPVLSAEYGLLRAFQQSLMFLGIFIVIGIMAFMTKFSNKKQIIFASFLTILFFLSNTGVITQALGGYYPQLNLNNDGKYYDQYYTHKSEVDSINWLEKEMDKDPHAPQPELQEDHSSYGKITALTNLNSISDIYPPLIQKDAYVYLGYTNVHKQQASILNNDDEIIYNYPIKFLDDNKNLIYNNGDVRIYK